LARSVRLDADEAWAAVEAAHTGILTSLRSDGWPISLPVWFVVLDRRVFISGPARAKKFVRIRRDPRVCFLVESGTRWAELKGVAITGRAKILEEGARMDQVRLALHEKYLGFRTPRSEMPEATRAHYDTPAAMMEIVPDERVLSWDNSRLWAARDSNPAP
jgi:PPOX class probable F420-dependent enzyme